jgi:hypothetical protein
MFDRKTLLSLASLLFFAGSKIPQWLEISTLAGNFQPVWKNANID